MECIEKGGSGGGGDGGFALREMCLMHVSFCVSSRGGGNNACLV